MKFKKSVILLILLLTGLVLYNVLVREDKFTVLHQKVTNCDDCTVNDEAAAVAIAEEILFKIYGKSNIEDQRPYEIKLLGNKVWSLKGSFNQSTLEKFLSGGVPEFGGTFEIDIDPRDGKILKIIHYK